LAGVNQFREEKPKFMAEGGIVKATPGGTDVTVGEAGQDEAVVPLEEEEETPEPETDPRDVRITALEAMVTQLQDALDGAMEQIGILSKGLVQVEGDVDQEPREEPEPPPSLLNILKSFT
jgi:uncharacterized coiled-coil protein SlyX